MGSRAVHILLVGTSLLVIACHRLSDQSLIHQVKTACAQSFGRCLESASEHYTLSRNTQEKQEILLQVIQMHVLQGQEDQARKAAEVLVDMVSQDSSSLCHLLDRISVFVYQNSAWFFWVAIMQKLGWADPRFWNTSNPCHLRALILYASALTHIGDYETSQRVLDKLEKQVMAVPSQNRDAVQHMMAKNDFFRGAYSACARRLTAFRNRIPATVEQASMAFLFSDCLVHSGAFAEALGVLAMLHQCPHLLHPEIVAIKEQGVRVRSRKLEE